MKAFVANTTSKAKIKHWNPATVLLLRCLLPVFFNPLSIPAILNAIIDWVYWKCCSFFNLPPISLISRFFAFGTDSAKLTKQRFNKITNFSIIEKFLTKTKCMELEGLTRFGSAITVSGCHCGFVNGSLNWRKKAKIKVFHVISVKCLLKVLYLRPTGGTYKTACDVDDVR